MFEWIASVASLPRNDGRRVDIASAFTKPRNDGRGEVVIGRFCEIFNRGNLKCYSLVIAKHFEKMLWQSILQI